MLKGWLAKRRQSKMINSQDAFKIFDDYLDAIVDGADEETFDRRCEALLTSYFIISNKYTEPTYTFNSSIAPYFNLSNVHREVSCARVFNDEVFTHKLTYNRTTVAWREITNASSDAFETFMLGKLVKNDLEIRVENSDNSDNDSGNLIWFALTPMVWDVLENKYGHEVVRGQFEPLTHNFWQTDYEVEILSEA